MSKRNVFSHQITIKGVQIYKIRPIKNYSDEISK